MFVIKAPVRVLVVIGYRVELLVSGKNKQSGKKKKKGDKHKQLTAEEKEEEKQKQVSG